MTNRLDPNLKATLEAMRPEDRVEAALRLMADGERGFSTSQVTAAFDKQLTNAAGDGYQSGSDTRDSSPAKAETVSLEEFLALELAKLTHSEDPDKPDSPTKPENPNLDPDLNNTDGVGSGNPVMTAEVERLFLQNLGEVR